MKLTARGKIFFCLSSYEERHIPKEAGFRWHSLSSCRSNCPACAAGLKRCWYTTEPAVAMKLKKYADADALRLIETYQREYESSKANTSISDIHIPTPPGLHLYPFQKAGVEYALRRDRTLIADDMGLGKTPQALCYINCLPENEAQRILIVCPASIKINWHREAEKWLTRKYSICVLNGCSTLPDFQAPCVLIVNYDILKKYINTFMKISWDLIIFDEAHYCKHEKSQRTKYSTQLSRCAHRVLLLTGTPLTNRPIELFPLLKMLNHPLGENFWRYAKRYCNANKGRYGWDFSGASHLDELQSTLRSTVMVRRKKSEVLTELPPKIRQVIELPVNGSSQIIEKEKNLVQEYQDKLEYLQLKAELARVENNNKEYEQTVSELRSTYLVAFSEISRIRHETALEKCPAAVEYIKNMLDQVEKLVVYAHHHDVVDSIVNSLNESGITTVSLTGRENIQERQAAIDAFQNDPTVRVIVCSITAAGVGITLTAASHVVFVELDWVPANITQAEDRLHRIGQKDTVCVYHLVLDRSIDANMAKILVEKQRIIDATLDVNDKQKEATKQISIFPVGLSVAEEKAEESEKSESEEGEIPLEERALIHAKLRYLASMCDGAISKDGIGFNRYDTVIGRKLAQLEELSSPAARLGMKILKKYEKQLSNFSNGDKMGTERRQS